MASTQESIESWIVHQRWYSGKGSAPRLRPLAALPIPSTDPAAAISLLLYADDSDDRIPVYQIPVVERHARPDSPAVIGRSDAGGWLVDGPHDLAFATSLLVAMTGGSSELGDAPVLGASVLTGEQSNTSIVVPRDGAVDLVIKVFRVVHHGDNPDAELQSVLSAAGIPFVPRFFGEIVGEWTDGHGGQGSGHLGVLQEFITGAEDGWRIALSAAQQSRTFAAEARELGAATAVMHAALADRLETRDPSVGDVVGMVAIWHGRLAAAVRDAAGLEPWRPRIEAAYDAAQDEVWPQLQRIHGDLHLGQVLRSPDRRWVFIDFEGEPLRSMSERTRPEPALRDVAGMLRSFDYAAAAGRLGASGAQDDADPSADARAWSEECRAAYLAGYAAAASGDLRTHQVLLDALELDKAVYEVSYEARNRPGWLPIPMTALARILGP
ncbi:MAG: aminoglycoside phosphotransferase [Micrococcales bacterium]|nr:aminoglycoside phosphotransferase [Micrococcales bacterium]